MPSLEIAAFRQAWLEPELVPGSMNIALAHHWLVGMRGGEKVLEQFSMLFPEAPIYTLVADPTRLSAQLLGHPLVTSMLQRFPGGLRNYKRLLPLFPLLIGELKVPAGVDFVLSSDAAVIKGLQIPDGVPHVCYCHSPPRYVWDMHETYMSQTSDLGLVGRAVFRATVPMVQRFDRRAAQRVDHFIANSRFVQERIGRCYGRESTVINPPVAVDDFQVQATDDGYYLVVSELAPYKRIDLAVEAFNALKLPLIVIGHGSELGRLRRMAQDNITFLGSQPFSVLKQHYERCRALIFPGIEDFGITPLEAQSAGKPVIGFACGGLLETTVEGATAILFREQKVASLSGAVRAFEERAGEFDPKVCRANAERFGPERFRREMKAFLAERYADRFATHEWRAGAAVNSRERIR